MDLINLMTAEDIDELYEDMEKLMQKLAWEAVERYDLPYSICWSECQWAFVRALNFRFNPKRGRFSTLLYTMIKFRFRTMQRLQIKEDREFPRSELNEETAGAAPEQRSPCLEAIHELSDDAKEIIALILETPRELTWNPPSPKQLLRRVKNYLRRHRGKSRKDLELAHREIEKKFRQIWATV